MYDINFFKNVAPVKKKIVEGEYGPQDASVIESEFESLRNPDPHLFNFETSNNCNMTCKMCPRTSLMTRGIDWIDDDSFEKALDQIKPHSEEDLESFWSFVRSNYDVEDNIATENSFYFYVVSRCLILHGFGEPLVDKNIIRRVQACTDRGIPTYFSCVPANIREKKIIEVMEAGLSVIKFSMDALDDEGQKEVRGPKNDFRRSFEAILKILEYKKNNPHIKTKVVITMIAFTEEQRQLHDEFLALWKKYPVYAYVKSQDNRWLHEEDEDMRNRSHYDQQYCEFPWTSMTIMANGNVVPCTQDYDTEMTMGNVREQSLKEIWNGPKYQAFRRAHITGDFTFNTKCRDRCDLKKVYQYVKGIEQYRAPVKGPAAETSVGLID